MRSTGPQVEFLFLTGVERFAFKLYQSTKNLAHCADVTLCVVSMDLRALPPNALLVLLAATMLLAVVQSARLFWQGFWRRRTIAVRRERGAEGEKRAEKLLREWGFGILGRQVAVSYDVQIDGEPVAIDLRSDYLVSYGDKRYVAEVKTGRAAPRIDTPATRRQLLEYRIAFDVDGVLLVDAEAERVHAVEFPLGANHGPQPSRLAWLLTGFVSGAVVVMIAGFAFWSGLR